MNYTNLPTAAMAYHAAYNDRLRELGTKITTRGNSKFAELLTQGCSEDEAREQTNDLMTDWRQDAEGEAEQAGREAETDWYDMHRGPSAKVAIIRAAFGRRH